MQSQTLSAAVQDGAVRVLLLEDSPIDARFLIADFQKRGGSEFSLFAVSRLAEAIEFLETEPVDVILLDLFLEESQGLETLSAVREAVPDVPVVVLSSLNDEALALQAVKQGAQDYLIKGSVDSHLLFRAIRYAIERKQVETGRRMIEERSLQMSKLEALGTLAGGVAHNFNNLLMAITGHCHFLVEKATDVDDKRHLESIKKAADRASSLTRQLLMFSHRETGAMSPTNLNRMIKDMEELVRSVLGEDIALELRLAPGIKPIQANLNQIQHMVMSLILNAREAVGKDGRIAIETRCAERDPGQAVELTVTDNGCGMSAATQAHIFEPFFTTKGLAIAAGLGLSTVYGIVEQHGGAIRVSSELGKGSSFVVTFPVPASAVGAA